MRALKPATVIFLLSFAAQGCQWEPTPSSTLAGMLASGGGAGQDSFGVLKLYPTARNGREWNLPPNGDQAGPEWDPKGASSLGDGVFHTAGQVRMTVKSPANFAWWRNVEMTGYIRYTGFQESADKLRPHWEWEVRGERHTDKPVEAAAYNDSVPAPPGSETPPGYPYHGTLNAHCLGTAYHGNIYADAEVHFEKELSHAKGYAEQRGRKRVPVFNPNQWFGFKFVVLNNSADRSVLLEAWVDPAGDGHWTKISSVQDSGDWSASLKADGCDAPPFSLRPDQVITWAGPWATFRSDSAQWDFKWLSIREIEPLP